MQGYPGRPRTLAVLLGVHDAQLHKGIADWAREHEWEIDTGLMSPAPLPSVHDWDGVLATVYRAEVAEWLRHLRCPAVRMLQARPLDEEWLLRAVPKVDCDYEAIGAAGAEHLLALGQPHFAFYRRHRGADAKAMERGFRAVMREAGRPAAVLDFLGDHPDVHPDHAVPREFRLGWLQRRLAEMRGPLAVMAEDDRFALDVMYAARRMRLRVPEDIAILGVDDKYPLLEVSEVAISSIDTNLRGVGYAAAALLARIVEGEPPPERPLLVPRNRVMARMSTATYAGTHRLANEALRHVRQNFRSPDLTSEGVAKLLRITPFGLQKILQREIGITLSQEILRLRMEEAVRLLMDSSLKLDSIAHDVGFGSGRNFARAFKKACGVTPQHWRASLEMPDGGCSTVAARGG
ncbi:substrate-binding domain-containing protein [Luteolibacter sp. LG18]|uniref:AraC family transcriptional regulator n=1 Tax=Luteolibacter sp. LG18 TaxID=2819286 RepID=UPI002B2C3F82|nr:hypothetical protein llg_14510 [Luteolibacter sp. LG18]